MPNSETSLIELAKNNPWVKTDPILDKVYFVMFLFG